MSDPMNEADHKEVKKVIEMLRNFFIKENIQPNTAFCAMVSLMLSHTASQKDPMAVVREITSDMLAAMTEYLKNETPDAGK